MIPIDLDVVTVESLDGARAIMALDGGHALDALMRVEQVRLHAVAPAKPSAVAFR